MSGGFVERELAVARGLASCRGDDARLDEADAEIAKLRAERDALRTELASMRACFEAADPLRSELRERAKRARQAALIEAAEICDRHANEWPQTIAAVLRATAKEKGND